MKDSIPTSEESLRIIHLFYEQISWADQTKIVEDRFFLAKDRLYIPLHWQDYDRLKNSDYVRGNATKCEARPVLLIWGDPSDAVVERIVTECAKEKIGYTFLDFDAQICLSDLLWRWTEGDISQVLKRTK